VTNGIKSARSTTYAGEWIKSSRSVSNAQCVEVRFTPASTIGTPVIPATDAPTGATPWRKSTRSVENAHCVEVHVTPPGTAVRDSKNTAGPTLAFTSPAWTTFLTHTH
jgi:hypothetical protein